jgi:G3E family GTPase
MLPETGGERMSSGKTLSVKKPVKLIFAGGFLGSGKTTALASLAKRLIQRDLRVGFITNDQSENLVDTVIVRQMLTELGVPVEEVVKGCFCCKFDELIEHVEKILTHDPDVLMGEPVGSCTDFVAAVANPIKIQYKDAFRFAPFSILVDPDRVRELLLEESETEFPEDVAYLFRKQIEEADNIVLNKIDLISPAESERLLSAIEKAFQDKKLMAVSAKDGSGMDEWLDDLLSGRPGANTVLRQIDYDRYAHAEAVLGWLNAAVIMSAPQPFDASHFAQTLLLELRAAFRQKGGEIGHLKIVITSAGKSLWANLTHLAAEPGISGETMDGLSKAALIINARVRLEPEDLEAMVRDVLEKVSESMGVKCEIDDLQCFSPAYPEPPHVIRESLE